MWSIFRTAVCRAQQPATVQAGARAADALGHPCAGSSRGFYFPRKNWFPWRVRLIHKYQAMKRKYRHAWPRQYSPEEAPIFGAKEDGTQLAFRDRDIRIGMKRLLEYARLMKGRQLEDAADWVECIGRMKSESILKLLRRTIKECEERHRWDIARTYIFDVQPQRGAFVKSLRKHSRGNFGVVKSPRHMFMVRVRQMPLEEFFHRIYVFNKVPRSMACDMRLALHQNLVNSQMKKQWAPYLCANSRYFHRRELKWLDRTRQFDYYQVRREWIQKYKANLLRASTESREARGLSPLSMLS